MYTASEYIIECVKRWTHSVTINVCAESVVGRNYPLARFNRLLAEHKNDKSLLMVTTKETHGFRRTLMVGPERIYENMIRAVFPQVRSLTFVFVTQTSRVFVAHYCFGDPTSLRMQYAHITNEEANDVVALKSYLNNPLQK